MTTEILRNVDALKGLDYGEITSKIAELTNKTIPDSLATQFNMPEKKWYLLENPIMYAQQRVRSLAYFGFDTSPSSPYSATSAILISRHINHLEHTPASFVSFAGQDELSGVGAQITYARHIGYHADTMQVALPYTTIDELMRFIRANEDDFLVRNYLNNKSKNKLRQLFTMYGFNPLPSDPDSSPWSTMITSNMSKDLSSCVLPSYVYGIGTPVWQAQFGEHSDFRLAREINEYIFKSIGLTTHLNRHGRLSNGQLDNTPTEWVVQQTGKAPWRVALPSSMR